MPESSSSARRPAPPAWAGHEATSLGKRLVATPSEKARRRLQPPASVQFAALEILREDTACSVNRVRAVSTHERERRERESPGAP
jgi:hypothetical protein